MNKAALDAYLYAGAHRSVLGAVSETNMHRLVAIDAYQRQSGIAGHLAEIGVLHGKVLILLGTLAGESETTLAIDVFENAGANYDPGGGSTTLDIVRSNFARFTGDAELRRLAVMAGDSLLIWPADVRRIVGPQGFRLFGIDGAHSHFHTVHDMRLAAELLVPGGVALVDDITNAGWPGVMEGVARYFLLEAERRLFPFMMCENKLWLTTSSHHHAYLAMAKEGIATAPDQARRVTNFFGHDIVGF